MGDTLPRRASCKEREMTRRPHSIYVFLSCVFSLQTQSRTAITDDFGLSDPRIGLCTLRRATYDGNHPGNAVIAYVVPLRELDADPDEGGN